MSRRFLPLLIAAATAGCASQEGFPSLSPRPIERQFGDLPPAGPCPGDPAAASCGEIAEADLAPAPIADDPAVATRLATLADAARAGAAAFDAVLPAANAAAPRAGEEGSDSWIAAQQQLSRIEAARAPTVDALASLDTLTLERARMPTSEADLAAIAAAREQVQRLAEAQQAEIERITALLAPS